MKPKAVTKYIPKDIESKWQDVWDKTKIYQPDMDTAKKPFYNLMMFPYPSAEGMHVGNMYAFTGSDIYGRFKRMQGYDVFEPMGLDGFGIHSENYALKIGKHPKEQAKVSQANFYRQLKATGNAFDWSRTLETYDPEYYKWTQWLFIKLFKAGLAYKKKADVNFCPSCKTVLADEQVIDGKCERCGTEVTKKALEQWFFRITKYADRLLKNIETLDWSEKVRIAQRQWIGRSEGAQIEFKVQNEKFKISVFTTRPDTLFGTTFLVISPEKAKKLMSDGWEPSTGVISYIEKSLKKDQIARTDDKKEKTGIDAGLVAVNPANNEEIPVWVADYVLGGYGTGAIMAVPGHDTRDFAFAQKFRLEIKHVISNEVRDPNKISRDARNDNDQSYVGPGKLINSGEWDGLEVPKDMPKVLAMLEKDKLGKHETTYHLRDWLISRQRYWGPPIPMIHCDKCDWVPVPEKDLPVVLPDVEDWKPLGTGKSPLASVQSFVHTTCPKCGGKATRETDVSDTFLDSSWYFFRYTSTEDMTCPWDPKRARKWLPVTMYIGGAEHSVLHLLYSRFITMVCKDLGLISHFEEPFTRFYAHGLLIKDGVKMSKSKGNVVIPDVYIGKYGADTLRTYLMFAGPYDQGGDFRDTGIEGMHRFLRKVWVLVHEVDKSATSHYSKDMHKVIKRVSDYMEQLYYNTAIAAVMEYYNALVKEPRQPVSKEEVKVLLQLLAPFAPHITEELYQNVILSGAKDLDSSAKSQNDNFQSIHKSSWPVYDDKHLVQDTVNIVVQVNGKVRDNIEVQSAKCKVQSEIEELAKKSEKVAKFLEGQSIKKVIYVPGKIINFVTG